MHAYIPILAAFMRDNLLGSIFLCAEHMMATILKTSNYDISATGSLINFLLDSRCLLSAASEPCRLPTCLPLFFVCHLTEVGRSRPSVLIRS